MPVTTRWRELKGGRKKAYLDIHHNGKRSYEFLKIIIDKNDPDRKEKKALVEDIRAKRQLEISAGEYGKIPKFKRQVGFLKYYQFYLDNYDKKDIRKVKYSLQKFKDFLGKDSIQIQHINTLLCEDFKDYLKGSKSGLTGETPYDYWKRFKGVLKRAVMEGLLDKNPADDITFKNAQSSNDSLRKNVLTSGELQALAKAKCGNKEVKRAFLFACYTGLGMAEIRKLNWSRIDNDKIILFRAKSKEQVINDLSQVALKLLGGRGKPNELIFTLPSDVAIRKDIITWKKRADIEKHISFYCARHTFAVQLLLNGANLKTVADLMGHSSTKYTLKYLKYTDSLKRQAVKNLPLINL